MIWQFKYRAEKGKTQMKGGKGMSEKSSGGGIGFCGLLTIAFIVLKLTGFIGWNWWWILAPTWMPLVAGVICLAIAFFCEMHENRKWRK